MIRRPAFLLIFAVLFLCLSHESRAFTPEVAAGMAAAKAAPSVVSAVKCVPSAIAQTFRLPLGIIEAALCPLPGATLAGGLSNIAKGLGGPLKLVGAALRVPFSLLGTVAGAG
jgi:hypothetical protein